MLLILPLHNQVKAQENEVDASRPTNLYTQINTVFEYQHHESGGEVYGTRINVQYTFDPDNLILVEFPLLYNADTDKFGLSDTRIRYFHAAKRDISKTLIAIAPYADISIPTGSFENGLGTSTWSLSAGVVAGLALSEKIALFPGIGYVHITEPSDYDGDSHNGINLQTNMSVKFNQRSFVFINPIVTILNDTIWSGEFNYNYMAKPGKLKLNIGYFPIFTNDIHTIRTGATFYF